jgi:hypothetical protein
MWLDSYCTIVERNAGTRKVGIQRQELSSSLSNDTATSKPTLKVLYRNTGKRKVGIQRQELWSSPSNDTDTATGKLTVKIAVA